MKKTLFKNISLFALSVLIFSNSVVFSAPILDLRFAKSASLDITTANQSIATQRILGRNTASAGAVEILDPSTVKTILSLNNVDNYSFSTINSTSATLTNKSISGSTNTLTNIAQSSVTSLTSDLATFAVKSNNLSDLSSSSTARTNLGLGNVDNTSDANKPVSTAQQTAIDGKVADAINNSTTTIAPSQNAVFDALALKQDSLGYTAENTANKATDFSVLNNTLYPTTSAVNTLAASKVADAINDSTTDVAPSQNVVFDALALKAPLISPSFTTPSLGVSTATSVNKVTITAPATSATLTIADGATLTASSSATVSNTNTGDETTTTTGNLINAAGSKTTPVDSDLIGLVDSAASNILKSLSWSNLKATLKTYFDTLYFTIGGALTATTGSFTDDITISSGKKLKNGTNNYLDLNVASGSNAEWQARGTVTVNIDADNNETTRFFGIVNNGGSTKLLRVDEDGSVTLGNTQYSGTGLLATGSFKTALATKTGTYTTTTADHTIEITSGTFTVNLVTAVGNAGLIQVISNQGSGTTTLDGNSSETIDGSTTQTATQYHTYTIQSDGTNWIILSKT